MDVYAARLAVVNLTMYYGGVRAGFDFETSDSVVVDVVCFEIALWYNKVCIVVYV